MTQVPLPWGFWEAQRGEARGEGETEVLVGTGPVCRAVGGPDIWSRLWSQGVSSKNESLSPLPSPLAQVGPSVGRPGAQG